MQGKNYYTGVVLFSFIILQWKYKKNEKKVVICSYNFIGKSKFKQIPHLKVNQWDWGYFDDHKN